jgi:hypothetical protein
MIHLIREGITHIQYVDDTILMVEGDDWSITHMKFILYCFEWLSGLKIIITRVRPIFFGMDDRDE